MERNGGGDLGAKQRFPSRWKNKSFPELEIPIRKTPNFPLFKKKFRRRKRKILHMENAGREGVRGEKLIPINLSLLLLLRPSLSFPPHFSPLLLLLRLFSRGRPFPPLPPQVKRGGERGRGSMTILAAASVPPPRPTLSAPEAKSRI